MRRCRYPFLTVFLVFLLVHASVSDVQAQSLSDLEQRAREMQQGSPMDMSQALDAFRETLQLMEQFRQQMDPHGRPLSPLPATTAEEEIERRRNIINSQYHSARSSFPLLRGEEEADKPLFREALPIEGYLLVNGGALNERIDLSYTIEEKFVGLLVVGGEFDPAIGRFRQPEDYAIQTISTDIKVLGVRGKTCRPSGQGCVWEQFTRQEIDSTERYPGFSDGVVSAGTAGRHVKIDAAAPDAYFFHGENGVSSPVSCSTASWVVDRTELNSLLERGFLVLQQSLNGGGWLGCRPNSNMLVLIYLKESLPQPITRVCENHEVQLLLHQPAASSRYVYTDEDPPLPQSDRLVLELEAVTIPADYSDRIEWTIPELTGATRTVNPDPGSTSLKGPRFTVTYEGLPADYREFGKHTISASVTLDSCVAKASRDVHFFYPRDARNNPGREYPNWFYYWRQTPSARPFGQTVNIRFGATEYDLCDGEHQMAAYKPAYLFKAIHICDLNEKLSQDHRKDFRIILPRVSRENRSTLLEKQYVTYTHIDTFAVLVMHEFTHYNNYHTWWEHKPVELWSQEDRDGDGIPDHLEPDMGFDPDKYQTYWSHDEEFQNINGDEEFLAYESTYSYEVGTYDAHDWGKPGKNWRE